MNYNTKDLKGQKFGRLLVIEKTDKRKYGDMVWLCKCDCGNYIEVATRCLTSKRNRSCGCLAKESAKQTLLKNSQKVKDNFKDNTNLNILNNTIFKSNTSGTRGVHLDKRMNRWVATIEFQKKKHYLGSYKNIEQAIKVRKEAEEKYFKPILDKYEKDAD